MTYGCTIAPPAEVRIAAVSATVLGILSIRTGSRARATASRAVFALFTGPIVSGGAFGSRNLFAIALRTGVWIRIALHLHHLTTETGKQTPARPAG